MVQNPPERFPASPTYLLYEDVDAALDSLSGAFGFTEQGAHEMTRPIISSSRSRCRRLGRQASHGSKICHRRTRTLRSRGHRVRGSSVRLGGRLVNSAELNALISLANDAPGNAYVDT